jgi:peptidoglycan/LPS O-acetylase OafA/YrhL
MADLFTTMIPFLFVLAIVYGALEVSGIFKNKGVKAIISFALAFFAISSTTTLAFITGILPYAAIFFIAFFLLGFMLSFFKGKKGEGGKDSRDWTLIAVVILLIAVFLTNYGYEWIETNLPMIDSENFVAVAGVVLILIILYAAYQRGKNNGS